MLKRKIKAKLKKKELQGKGGVIFWKVQSGQALSECDIWAEICLGKSSPGRMNSKGESPEVGKGSLWHGHIYTTKCQIDS